MNLYTLSFSPHMVEDTLNLIERRGHSIKVADYEIFVYFSSFLKDTVRSENSRDSFIRQSDRSKALQRLIL